MGFSGGSDSKESVCSAEDPGLIPGLGRSPGKRNGYPLVFFPGEFHGQRSLVGYSPWGHKQSDLAERLTFSGPLTGEFFSSVGNIVASHCPWLVESVDGVEL